MPASDIVIKGAREHNLRDVDVILPRNKLICLTGVSGSGKSSLAFDTLYAEGQRRYIESLSTFARQFLGQLPKPDVDYLAGLSPTISISQKTSGRNPRSTVGTITEIYDYLRVLFARVGQGHCPECQRPITAQTREAIIARIMTLPPKTKFSVLAPVVRQQKGEFRDLFSDLLRRGYVRARVDGEVIQLTDDLSLDRQMRHDIEVVVDRLVNKPDVRSRLAEAVEQALQLGDGNLVTSIENDDDVPTEAPKGKRRRGGLRPGDTAHSAAYACTHCGLSFEPPSPQLFSFNSPQGMCLTCDGLGEFFSFDPEALVTEPSKSLKDGCIELLGKWKELGKWKRHIYAGLAETMERKLQLDEGHLLETPWEQLEPELQELLLWGTGDELITFTWRMGRSSQKYGGAYEGIIPEFLEKYHSCKSKPLLRKLEGFMSVIHCPDCDGERLNPQARSMTITTADDSFETVELSLPEVCKLPVRRAAEFFKQIELDETGQLIAGEALKEITGRLGFLMDVGLDYLSLDRTAPTLSGGESQRIRLAGQIGCGLVGVLYILDEPSIGLHARDNARLLGTLERLRDQGNTVVVVEHDEDTMRAADHVVDFGPGAGVRGGEVVAVGDMQTVAKAKRSVTGAYLSGTQKIEIPKTRRTRREKQLTIKGARHNNLKNVDIEIPLGLFVCVTGVSGSGKSSFVNDILVEALRRDLNNGKGEPGEHDKLTGLDNLDKLIAIDQSPIGRTPRSNPSTYIKVFDDIRNLYAQLPESKKRGYKPGRFSFNVKTGRCEACEGNGANKLEMDFLADVWVTCPVCEGNRFNHETLQVKFREKSIADVLDMDVQEALEHFENITPVAHKLQTLHDVGLDYIKLGQPSPTLSGGEAQRIKLARELVKKSTGSTLYLLDEPTTGLHFADIQMLLKVLHDFVEQGNTVLVVEHNLDVIKTADWIIDMGPEGGSRGGRMVTAGTPEDVANYAAEAFKKNGSAKLPRSHTGEAIAPLLNGKPLPGSGTNGKATISKKVKLAQNITIDGATQHNLKDISVKIPRDEMTVFCGPSGSGKTSLAMDTIYAEGQRRYVESLSSYARQFVGQLQKPRVEHVEGLSPAIAIEQRHLGHTPRSTVGTVTEIYDYFRILFARLGQPYCPDCDLPVGTQSADEVIDKIMAEPEGTKLYLMAPVFIEVGGDYDALWEELKAAGYVRVRLNGSTHSIDDLPRIDRRRKHAIEVVLDRVVVRPGARGRIADTVENALALGRGVIHIAYPQKDVDENDWQIVRHSQHRACDKCGRSFEELTPHHFSFNSAVGWCDACEGLGTQHGANPAALIRDEERSLADGAILLWPGANEPLFAAMLAGFSRATGVPTDVPFSQLSARHRRSVLFGTGDRWLEAKLPVDEDRTEQTFRFQYKGLYPALEEAARLSPGLRDKMEDLVDEIECSECGGARVRDDAAAVQFRGRTIGQVARIPLGELLNTVKNWQLPAREKKVAGELVREITNRLTFLVEVGLDYLTIGRSAPTLSGGESQRIRLASQVGSGLCGVLYVLDEPTIGLHPRDNRRLITALNRLRDLGNTLLVVEHDKEVVENADRLLDFGPAAGRHGGEIVAQGSPETVMKRRKSVTGPYLNGTKAIAIPSNRRIANASATENGVEQRPLPCLEIVGARHHNLKDLHVPFPLGVLTVVAGVSGSGKSTLVHDILNAQLSRTLHRARGRAGAHDAIRGIEHINKIIRVDQTPLGNSPTSNPATYTGLFDLIRELFANLPEAKIRGYQPRRFSFNVPGGRCDDCEGAGQKCIEMHFLPDVWVECDTCHGKRYNPDTLAVRYRGRSIADVLEMSCGEARQLFHNIPKICRILDTLCDVGLDYVTLGQAANTLSGGEAQRVKLASELGRPDTGRTLYLLDEPTTGLHFSDIQKLLDVLHRLVDLGNTVVVIEHNLDVLKQADWIVELGPEPGVQGGYVVVAGTPEQVVHNAESFDGKQDAPDPQPGMQRELPLPPQPYLPNETAGLIPLRSHTGEALAEVLARGPYEKRKLYDPHADVEDRPETLDIADVGEGAQMPWEENGRRWHIKDRVSRDGTSCRWEGKILDEIEQRIHDLGEFSATNWNDRSVVEIAAPKKSDGWFFHAITAEKWLVRLKFRVKKNTFQRPALAKELDLIPWDDIHDIPRYGSEPRVKCKNLRGPWQEVQIDALNYKEIDTPAFWSFLEQAVNAFHKVVERAEKSPEDLMPWKKLGEKWHLSRKGFPPGKSPKWETEVLEELIELINDCAPGGEILWNNQQIVHVMLPERSDPWASIHTKRLGGVDLVLNSPKGRVGMGRFVHLGTEQELLNEQTDRDSIRIRLKRLEEIQKDDFRAALNDHLDAVQNGN